MYFSRLIMTRSLILIHIENFTAIRKNSQCDLKCHSDIKTAPTGDRCRQILYCYSICSRLLRLSRIRNQLKQFIYLRLGHAAVDKILLCAVHIAQVVQLFRIFLT